MEKILQPISSSDDILAAQAAEQARRQAAAAAIPTPVTAPDPIAATPPTVASAPSLQSSMAPVATVAQPVNPAAAALGQPQPAIAPTPVQIPTVLMPTPTLPVTKPKLPRGVPILAVLTILATVGLFLTPNSNSITFTIVTVIDALLAIALFTHDGIARECFIFMAVVTVIVAGIDIVDQIKLRNTVDSVAAQVSGQAVQQSVPGSAATAPSAAELQAQLARKRADANHKLLIAGASIGVVVLIDGVTAIYLLRPKARTAFTG